MHVYPHMLYALKGRSTWKGRGRGEGGSSIESDDRWIPSGYKSNGREDSSWKIIEKSIGYLLFTPYSLAYCIVFTLHSLQSNISIKKIN